MHSLHCCQSWSHYKLKLAVTGENRLALVLGQTNKRKNFISVL